MSLNLLKLNEICADRRFFLNNFSRPADGMQNGVAIMRRLCAGSFDSLPEDFGTDDVTRAFANVRFPFALGPMRRQTLTIPGLVVDRVVEPSTNVDAIVVELANEAQAQKAAFDLHGYFGGFAFDVELIVVECEVRPGSRITFRPVPVSTWLKNLAEHPVEAPSERDVYYVNARTVRIFNLHPDVTLTHVARFVNMHGFPNVRGNKIRIREYVAYGEAARHFQRPKVAFVELPCASMVEDAVKNFSGLYFYGGVVTSCARCGNAEVPDKRYWAQLGYAPPDPKTAAAAAQTNRSA